MTDPSETVVAEVKEVWCEGIEGPSKDCEVSLELLRPVGWCCGGGTGRSLLLSRDLGRDHLKQGSRGLSEAYSVGLGGGKSGRSVQVDEVEGFRLWYALTSARPTDIEENILLVGGCR